MLWLESLSPDERWLVIRWKDRQGAYFIDFIDLRTGQVARTWKAPDTRYFEWYEPGKLTTLVDESKLRYLSVDPETGEEVLGSKRLTEGKVFSGKKFMFGSVDFKMRVIDKPRNREFHGVAEPGQQQYRLTVTPIGGDQAIGEVHMPINHCLHLQYIVIEMIPEHPWIVAVGTGSTSLHQRFPWLLKNFPWLARYDHSYHEFRLIDWSTGSNESFYQSKQEVEYLVSSMGFFLHTESPTQHIIEFWPWPVGQRNWWWLLAPWGCALLLWIAGRAIKRNNRATA
jgi:hypothetical protein